MNTAKPYFPDEKQLMNKLVSFVIAAYNESKTDAFTKHFRPIRDITIDSNYRFTVKIPHWGSPKREVEVKSVAGDKRRVCAIYMLNAEASSKEEVIREERITDCSRENIYQLAQRINLFLTQGQFESKQNTKL